MWGGPLVCGEVISVCVCVCVCVCVWGGSLVCGEVHYCVWGGSLVCGEVHWRRSIGVRLLVWSCAWYVGPGGEWNRNVFFFSLRFLLCSVKPSLPPC